MEFVVASEMIWFASLTFFALSSQAFLLVWALRANRRAAQTQTTTSLAQLELLDKCVAILASRDPLTFQQIQAMNGVVQYDEWHDPSDEADIQRMKERDGAQGDDLNEHDRDFIQDFAPGLLGPE